MADRPIVNILLFLHGRDPPDGGLDFTPRGENIDPIPKAPEHAPAVLEMMNTTNILSAMPQNTKTLKSKNMR